MNAPRVRPVSERAPGPRGLPVIGSARDMVTREIAFIGDMVAQYGPIVTVKIGRRWLWLVTAPELIDDLLVKRASAVIKDEVTGMLKTVVGNGLLTSEGELWKRQRRLAAPALQRRHVEGYAATMTECAVAYADGLVDGEPRDLHHDMMAVTLRIVARTLFGTDVREEVGRVGAALDAAMEQFDREIHTWRIFLPQTLPTPGRRRIRQAREVLEGVVRQYIAESRARGAGGDDLLSMLIAARDDDGSGMDDTQLVDEAITLFVAGHETTALVLTFAQLALASAPEAAARMDAELRDVLDGRPPTLADMAALPYTNAVVKETMRVHPPAWIMGRETAEPIELGGYVVPKGHTVLIPIYWLHRNPVHFPDPERFDPDRWLGGELERMLPKHAYLPFGSGPRVCIGNHFAVMEAVLSLAAIRQRWRFEPAPGHDVEVRPSVTLRPVGGVPGTMRRA